LVLQLVQNA